MFHKAILNRYATMESWGLVTHAVTCPGTARRLVAPTLLIVTSFLQMSNYTFCKLSKNEVLTIHVFILWTCYSIHQPESFVTQDK